MKSKAVSENYLERIPVKNQAISWNADEKGIVTLEVKNTGFLNRICQRFFRKPPVSFIHLDSTGSFVWPLIDGEKNIVEIGVSVKEHFASEAEPLYERLAEFFQILESYNFITFK